MPSFWTMPHVERLVHRQPFIPRALGRFVLILAALSGKRHSAAYAACGIGGTASLPI